MRRLEDVGEAGDVMPNFERLGEFYLGRLHDQETETTSATPLLYDSRDLVTHGVCIGMTGSGKTGLGITILEEAAIDGIPAIVIDPKGDLANLLLTFPSLAASDFRPWIDEAEAARQGLTPEAFATREAATWREGLAEWGQDGDRVGRLRAAVDMTVYTPGSTAGTPISILRSFTAPPPAVREDAEQLTERISTAATSILGLAGFKTEDQTAREYVLVCAILDAAWRAGEDLDLALLIRRIQSPPMSRLGVLELESFYPAKDRFELAVRLNGLLASPGFAAWLEGVPLDVESLLYGPDGRPRISVVSIAHLDDAERMFLVSLLLSEIVGWMRSGTGTTSLRAILYMDEVFGYLPPVANPPSKAPLLTLLKQARAYGLGVVLATQNPVDLDYKALSNAGTWFLGRLQTERDKARVLDGLEGIQTSSTGLSRADLDRLLSALGKRVFLMHNVHESAPVTFKTRWALSYLRGPLARHEIQRLSAKRPEPARAPDSTAERPTPARQVSVPRPHPRAEGRPVLPPGITERFVAVQARSGAAAVHYAPHMHGSGDVRFVAKRHGIDTTRTVAFLVPLDDGPAAVDWTEATETHLALGGLVTQPAPGATFGPLPPSAAQPGSYVRWTKRLGTWLARTRTCDVLTCPTLKLTATPDETERDFRLRLQIAARERRDTEKERLRSKYASRVARATDRVRRAHERIARESEQVSQQRLQTALSFGATVLGAFLGRKALGAGTIGRATTAARGAGRTIKESQDVERAKARLDAATEALAELERDLDADLATIETRLDPQALELETLSISPTRARVNVHPVVLVWIPSGD